MSHDVEKQLLFAVLRASAATCHETTVGGDDEETNEGHDEAVGHGRVVGNQSHEHGSHGTADDPHDEQRGGDFRATTQTAEREGEDGGEHDAFAEIDDEQRRETHAAGRGHDEHGAVGGDKSENGEETFGADVLHDPTAEHATGEEKPHAADTEDKTGIAAIDAGTLHGIVDEETVHAGLCRHVDENTNPSEEESAVAEQHMEVAVIVIAPGFECRFLGLGEFVLLGSDFGQTNAREQEGDDHDHDADEQIGHGDVGRLVFVVEEEVTTGHRTDNPTQTVEGLREIDALFAVFGLAEHGDIGVGGGFEEGESAPDDEEATEEEGEGHDLRAGNEEQRADAVENKAEQHAGTVAVAANEGAGGQRHEEISAVDHDLDVGRFGFGEVQRVLEVLVQHIENAVGETPQKEEGGDQKKRGQIVAPVASAY